MENIIGNVKISEDKSLTVMSTDRPDVIHFFKFKS